MYLVTSKMVFYKTSFKQNATTTNTPTILHDENVVDIDILVVLFHNTYSDKTHSCRSFKIDVMSIHRLKTKNPWMIMSKDNC